MANSGSCTHGNAAPSSLVETLPESQAGLGRHKCTICAYAIGSSPQSLAIADMLETCKHGHSAPVSVLVELPESQKVTEGRHRCAVCAYAAGRQERQPAPASYPDELPQHQVFPEGLQKTVVVNAYERNANARRKCVDHYGYTC